MNQGRAKLFRPGFSGRPVPVVSPENLAAAQRAREAIQLFLRHGQKQVYLGEQVTRLLQPGGRVLETRQIVKYAGPGRMRIEYMSPPALKDETILISNGRIFHYKPNQAVVLDGIAPPEEFQSRIKELLQGVRNRAIQVLAVGEELIAGRQATIVEIRSVRGGEFYYKFWIDDQTGSRLKNESIDPQGRVVSDTYFTRIDYEPAFSPQDFQPASLPNVPHEPLLPDRPGLASIQAAQPQVSYTIREPNVPTGFRLGGVWVVPGFGGRQTIVLRYTDGVNTFALFETPMPQREGNNPKPIGKQLGRMRNGVAHWMSDGLAFILVGNLKPENVRLIVESLQ